MQATVISQESSVQDFSDDEDVSDFSEFTSDLVDMSKLNFPSLLEQYRNKAGVISRLIKLLDRNATEISDDVDSTAKTPAAKTPMVRTVKANKHKKVDSDIVDYVIMFDNVKNQKDILAWATKVLYECETPIVNKLKSYFQKEKKIIALTGLENAKSLIAKLDDIKTSFDAIKILELLENHDFLAPIISQIIEFWKTTPFVNIPKSAHSIIKKIIKVFYDQPDLTSISFDDLCAISSVRNEISDWHHSGYMFDFEKFKEIVDGSYYSMLFTITVSTNKSGKVGASTSAVGTIDDIIIININKDNFETFKTNDKLNKSIFLETDTLISQLSTIFKTMVKPTELQNYLYGLLNSDEDFAVCLDSAPGSGKSTGMLTNKDGIIVYLPINIKAYKEMIISLTCARIPFVLAQKTESGGDLAYVPSWETMGKIAKYDTTTGRNFEHSGVGSVAKSLVEVYRRLKQLESRTSEQEKLRNAILKQEDEELYRSKRSDGRLTREDINKIESAYKKRSRNLGKKTFFSADIKFVVCHPELRVNGAVKTYLHAKELAIATNRYFLRKDGTRCLTVTAIVDDFGANGEDMIKEHDVTRLCFGADRIILSSGTCPNGIDDPTFSINTTRVEKGKKPFIHRTFDKTLGLGIELNYTGRTGESAGSAGSVGSEKLIPPETRFSLLYCDKSVFEKCPTALQTITLADTFAFLKKKYGPTTIRNYLLDSFLTITLDNLRQEVFDWVYSFSDKERILLVKDVIDHDDDFDDDDDVTPISSAKSAKLAKSAKSAKSTKSTKSDLRTQTLYLSVDPHTCATERFGSTKSVMATFDGVEMPYLDFLQHRINNYESALRARNKEIISLQKLKSVDDGMTTESMIRDLGEVEFNMSGVLPMFNKQFIEHQLEYRGRVKDDQIHFLLQKGALVVDDSSDNTWIDIGIKKAISNIVGYPVQMGVGVDMPKLTKVYLDETTSPAITRQNMGRVGRSSQGCQGTVVFPNIHMLIELFDTDVGENLRPIFQEAVRATLQRNR